MTEFDANVVKTKSADDIAKDIEAIRQRQGEFGQSGPTVHMGAGGTGAGVANVKKEDKDEEKVEKGEEEIVVEDYKQPLRVPRNPSKITVRRTEVVDDKTVMYETIRERTQLEKEGAILQVLRDCGADSMQQIRGLERIKGIIWGS